MPKAKNGSIELEYDTFGLAENPAVLLIMGLTAQMIMWDERFCQQMAARDLFVIRFDNRDVGLSTKTVGATPNVMSLIAAIQSGQPVADVLYNLSDMADDAVAVLDALDVERANIVGASMGGMIAQTMAIEHPDRVASLTSITSTTGDPTVGQATQEAMSTLFTPPPSGREANIERGIEMTKLFAGVHFDEGRARSRITASYDRCFYPPGGAFQMAAIVTSGDRTPKLANVTAPTLVIHGGADPLVQPSGGEATAKAIPGAQLVMIDDMGHDLPPSHWGYIIDTIAAMAHNT